jgi:hypothetical protein
MFENIAQAQRLCSFGLSTLKQLLEWNSPALVGYVYVNFKNKPIPQYYSKLIKKVIYVISRKQTSKKGV